MTELRVKEAALYRSIYCGLCRSMGKTTGQLSRFTLSYDMVFLVLVRLAATGEMPKFERIRCPAHPLRRRVAMQPCEALTFSAQAGGLLVYRKWQDNLRDERGIKRFFYRLLSPFFRKIRRRTVSLAKLGATMDEALAELHRLEDANTASADACADRFGDLLAAMMAEGLGDTTARIVADIGFHTGRFIYLLDAADDAARDRKSGSYNPFLAVDIDPAQNKLVQNALRLELAAIEAAYALLDVSDAGVAALIANILYLGMPRRADEVLGFLPNCKCKQTTVLPSDIPPKF